MTRRGLDYSWGRPSGAAIKAAGFDFVIRYVPYPGHGGKGLEAREIEDLRANGIAIGIVFESTAGRPLAGMAAGVTDATHVVRAIGELGMPPDLPCYFAVDFDAQPSQMAAIHDYLRGAATVIGSERIGVYGSYRVVEQCYTIGTAKWFWQALAWSGGRHFVYRHLYQSLNGQTVDGAEVDYNEAYRDTQGLWEVEDNEDVKAQELFDTLNSALIKREQMRHVAAKIMADASNPDLPAVESAHAELQRLGLI